MLKYGYSGNARRRQMPSPTKVGKAVSLPYH